MCLQHTGLSHSEISGSKFICNSPELIAAYHVLHRLREPRHPPCALSYFLFINTHCNCLRCGWYILSACTKKYYFLLCSICHRSFIKWRNLMIGYVRYAHFAYPILNAWRITDSNRWPPACKAGALASWANPPINLWFMIYDLWKSAWKSEIRNLKSEIF